VGELLVELERLLELAEFFLEDPAALEHRGAGLGDSGYLLTSFAHSSMALRVGGGDFLRRAFAVVRARAPWLRAGAEQIEDARGARVERMGAQEFVEALHREFLLFAGERLDAQLELGVDDRVLAFRPLGAVRVKSLT
jgi:hypothetical protein